MSSLGSLLRTTSPKTQAPNALLAAEGKRTRPSRVQARGCVIFVPPMAKAAAPFPKPTQAVDSCQLPALQLLPEGGDGFRSPEIASDAEGDPQKLAWVEERKQLRSQLESIANVGKWLMGKPACSSQEERVWERIKVCRADRRAESKSAMTHSLGVLSVSAVSLSLGSLCRVSSTPAGVRILGNGGLRVFSALFQHSPPASGQPWQGGHPPLIRAPYPPALVTLHNLLHKQKLTMVDVFKRAGMDRRKITRADFIHVIKAVRRELKRQELLQLCCIFPRANPEWFPWSKFL